MEGFAVQRIKRISHDIALRPRHSRELRFELPNELLKGVLLLVIQADHDQSTTFSTYKSAFHATNVYHRKHGVKALFRQGGVLMSMPYIVLHQGLFDGQNREASEDTILKLLAVLVDRNCQYLRAHPDTPKLYDSGVTYALPDQMTKQPDEKKLARLVRFLQTDMDVDEETVDIITTVLRGCEVFRDIPSILEKGQVDCDNLACWRVAELRCQGVEAVPYIIWREGPRGTTYHALLRHPDGTSEDPSRILGMGEEPERAEEKRKNKERYGNEIAIAKTLVDAGLATALEAGRRIDALGLLPKGKKW